MASRGKSSKYSRMDQTEAFDETVNRTCLSSENPDEAHVQFEQSLKPAKSSYPSKFVRLMASDEATARSASSRTSPTTPKSIFNPARKLLNSSAAACSKSLITLSSKCSNFAFNKSSSDFNYKAMVQFGENPEEVILSATKAGDFYNDCPSLDIYEGMLKKPGSQAIAKTPDVIGFQDFLPTPRLHKEPEIPHRREKFSELVARANSWLYENKEFVAVFCQTVSIFEPPKQKRRRHKPDSTVLKIGYSFGHIFGLRVWLAKNPSGFPQRLQYFDTVPRLYIGQRQQGVKTYESTDRVVFSINATIMEHELPGRIITIETVTTPHPDDPELCHFWERKDIQDTQYVQFLRIFVEEAGPMRQIIGITDFSPKILESTAFGVPFSSGRRYESFQSVLQRANVWLKQQNGLKVVTVQTIPQREEFYGTDETETFFVEPGFATADFLRLLRIAYVRDYVPYYDEDIEVHSTEIPEGHKVHCKTFSPITIKMVEETRQQQIERAIRWINSSLESSEVHEILWVETCLFRRYEEHSMASIIQKGDIMYRDRSMDYWDTHYRFCIRVYYVGPQNTEEQQKKGNNKEMFLTRGGKTSKAGVEKGNKFLGNCSLM